MCNSTIGFFVCARKFVNALIVQKKIHSCPIGIKKVRLMFIFYSFKSSQLQFLIHKDIFRYSALTHCLLCLDQLSVTF